MCLILFILYTKNSISLLIIDKLKYIRKAFEKKTERVLQKFVLSGKNRLLSSRDVRHVFLFYAALQAGILGSRLCGRGLQIIRAD